MEKYDSNSSRSTAFATEADDALDDNEREADAGFDRPARRAAASKLRAGLLGTGKRNSGARRRESAGNDQPESLDDFEAAEQQDSAFLRARKRVPIRRRRLPSSRFGRTVFAVLLVILAVGALLLALWVRDFFRNDPLFRIDSTSSIQTTGNHVVTRAELLNVFGSDIGRNVFYVPLKERRTELEQIPWVESAAVMRVLPSRLRVVITERVPIAFVRLGNTVALIDAHGVLLHMPSAAMAARHYSFPVISGIRERDAPAMWVAKIAIYQKFMAALDAGGVDAEQKINEVNLSDPEDVRALILENGRDILLHFGNNDYLERYQRFQQHIAGWQKEYPDLASIDLRYENQVVLDMAPAEPVKALAPGSSKTTGAGTRSKDAGHSGRRQR